MPFAPKPHTSSTSSYLGLGFLLSSVSFLLTSITFANTYSNQCQELLLVKRLVDRTSSNLQTDEIEITYLNLLQRNRDAFIEYLKKQGIQKTDEITYLQKRKAVTGFLGESLIQLTGSSLAERQSDSLSRSLIKHGIDLDFSTMESRHALANISAKNKIRLLGQKTEKTADIDDEIVQAVSNIELGFSHNSSNEPQGGTMLLSSHQIEKLGLRLGLNQHSFNRDFLQTDDNVYFFVRFYNKKRNLPFLKSGYGGEIMITTDKPFAEKTGMISAFLMYPEQLINIRQIEKPDDASLMSQTQPANNDWSNAPEEWIKARNQLHHYDFTVSDFENMIRIQLIHALAELKNKSPSKYKKAIRVLKAFSEREIEKLLSDLVFERLSLPNRWELKIPIGVPVEHYKVILLR